MRLTVPGAAAFVLSTSPAAAHDDAAAGSGAAVAMLWAFAACLALWHARGAFRQWPPRLAAARAFSLSLGLLVALAAVNGPAARWAEHSLAAHMGQHMLLLLAAPPLLLLGRPLPALLRAMPHARRRRAAAVFGARLPSPALHPMVAALLQASVVSSWHVPLMFAAAEADGLLHALEHASLLAVGLLYWQGQIDPRGAVAGAILASLVTIVWCGFLGALLTFAPVPLFDAPLQEQQLAGLLMWVPCGFAYLAGALTTFTLHVLGPRRRWA